MCLHLFIPAELTDSGMAGVVVGVFAVGAVLRIPRFTAGQTGLGVGVGALIRRIRADAFVVFALLHRHCAGQRLIAQHARKGSAAFVKIGVPGVAAVTQQVAEGEG